MKLAIITTFAHKVHIARDELLKDLQKSNYDVTIMGPEYDKTSIIQLKERSIDYVQLNIERINLNPINELLYLNDTKKKLVSNKIDIVLVYGIRMIPSIVIAAKLAKVKRIVCIVNGAGNLFMPQGLKGRMAQSIAFPMLSLALRISDSVIFQNKDDFRELKRKRLVTNRNVSFINGSGVNIEMYKKTSLPEDLNFLLVTRVTGNKGVNEYVKAAQIVSEKYPEASFGLVGPKDDQNDDSINWDEIEDAVKKDVIQYYGETRNVLKHLKKCRFYIFPSYREGLPRSTLEAMSIGRPIITTDSPGCRETVVQGLNGFLVPIKNAEILAEKMIWMIENPKSVEKMALESRRITIEKFDINKVNKEIIDNLDI